MSNPFNKYKSNPTVHFIESLGAEVTLRELTYGEAEKFLKEAVKGEEKDGTPILDMEAIAGALLAKVSLALVEPKMSVEDLEALSVSSREALMEIAKIVEGVPSGKSNSPTETSLT